MAERRSQWNWLFSQREGGLGPKRKRRSYEAGIGACPTTTKLTCRWTDVLVVTHRMALSLSLSLLPDLTFLVPRSPLSLRIRTPISIVSAARWTNARCGAASFPRWLPALPATPRFLPSFLPEQSRGAVILLLFRVLVLVLLLLLGLGLVLLTKCDW